MTLILTVMTASAMTFLEDSSKEISKQDGEVFSTGLGLSTSKG